VCVQVNAGSIAENCGLRAGDAVLQIGGRASDELGHEQAKQEIVASGNSVSLVVQRYNALPDPLQFTRFMLELQHMNRS